MTELLSEDSKKEDDYEQMCFDEHGLPVFEEEIKPYEGRHRSGKVKTFGKLFAVGKHRRGRREERWD